jgi:hypothetical protein
MGNLEPTIGRPPGGFYPKLTWLVYNASRKHFGKIVFENNIPKPSTRLAETGSDVPKIGRCHGSEILAFATTLVDFKISALSLALIFSGTGDGFNPKIGFKL